MKRPEKLSTLKARLWRLTSEFVRKSRMDSAGHVQCVTCPQSKPYREIHAGHFLPKKKGSAVYFDLRNIHPQCVSCNVWQRGNIHAYYDYMLMRYGEEVIADLKYLARQPLKLTRVDYAEKISEMITKINNLRNG
jgi:hypothetical protein